MLARARSASEWYAKETEEGEKMFTWTDTTSNEEEVTLYLFAEDAVFESVRNTNGGQLTRKNLLSTLQQLR